MYNLGQLFKNVKVGLRFLVVSHCNFQESPTFFKNGGTNSGSRDRLSPSRHSTTKTRLYVKNKLTCRANERRQQILKRQNRNRNFNYQRRNLFESRVRQSFPRR
uniref:Uncharacterized protein n=1 Tax=Strongyloides venezuelensis TaxID=75913 RepID=A0A0K0G5X3_STRVS